MPGPFPSRTPELRRLPGGFTLIELLVVIVIAITLVAVTLPLVKFAMEDAKLREASRQVNAFVAGVKARAAQTGLPAGVWIERDAPGANTATRLYVAEVAAPYGGGTIGAKGRVMVFPSESLPEFRALTYVSGAVQTDVSEMALLQSLIEQGDRFYVQFDYKGEYFVCVRGKPGMSPYTDPAKFYYLGTRSGYPIVPPAWNMPYSSTTGYAFQILRQPRRTSSAPLELPKGTVIDLQWSGLGLSGNEFNASSTTDAAPVAILFDSGGRVDAVAVHGSTVAAAGSVHLLIGRVEKSVQAAPNSNLQDPACLWVTIGTQTGSVTTNDLMLYDPLLSGTPLEQARSDAVKHQTKGGR